MVFDHFPISLRKSVTMEDPETTEVENKESQAINNGSEKSSDELSQQSASLDIASGETPETESTALLKEEEKEESLECRNETKSGKRKKKKKKKKMTNVATENTEQLLSTSTSNVEETNAKIDSASKGRTSGKECEELDPAEDSPANKKKKKKKKRKTDSKVCGTLGKQLDNQDTSSAPKEEKSVEDQGDSAENSPVDTAATSAEERNAPDPEKEDGSSSEIVPDVVKPELALENQLDNQDIGSAPKEEKSVDQGDLTVVKNEKQENDADTKSQKECDDAVSGGLGNDSKNLSADAAAARTEEGNVPAPKKEEDSSSEMVPDEVKPELATISDEVKESDLDKDKPEEEEGKESDSADNLSDEPDNEG